LVFSTGTTDNFVRAYNVFNGEQLWEHQLNYAGSAPPMTYFYNNCQYIIVNASGGRFVGFDKSASNLTVAFKLNNCQ